MQLFEFSGCIINAVLPCGFVIFVEFASRYTKPVDVVTFKKFTSWVFVIEVQNSQSLLTKEARGICDESSFSNFNSPKHSAKCATRRASQSAIETSKWPLDLLII